MDETVNEYLPPEFFTSDWQRSGFDKALGHEVPNEVIWFENHWKKLQEEVVFHTRDDKRNKDYVLVSYQIRGLRAISMIEIGRIGKRGGLMENLYVYDPRDAVHGARIKAWGRVRSVISGSPAQIGDLRHDVKEGMLTRDDRKVVINRAVGLLTDLVQRLHSPDKEPHLYYEIYDRMQKQSESVYALNIGFPGMGKTK